MRKDKQIRVRAELLKVAMRANTLGNSLVSPDYSSIHANGGRKSSTPRVVPSNVSSKPYCVSCLKSMGKKHRSDTLCFTCGGALKTLRVCDHCDLPVKALVSSTRGVSTYMKTELRDERSNTFCNPTLCNRSVKPSGALRALFEGETTSDTAVSDSRAIRVIKRRVI